jgi:hypothetical protein
MISTAVNSSAQNAVMTQSLIDRPRLRRTAAPRRRPRRWRRGAPRRPAGPETGAASRWPPARGPRHDFDSREFVSPECRHDPVPDRPPRGTPWPSSIGRPGWVRQPRAAAAARSGVFAGCMMISARPAARERRRSGRPRPRGQRDLARPAAGRSPAARPRGRGRPDRRRSRAAGRDGAGAGARTDPRLARACGCILDGAGFVAGLRAAGHDPRGASAYLAGAGGAANGPAAGRARSR